MDAEVEEELDRLEERIGSGFPGARIEYSASVFPSYIEFRVFVLDLDRYQHVKDFCRQLEDDENLGNRAPKIWVMVRTWTGPWPGGESEQELRSRREEFRLRHNLPTRS